MEPVLWEPHQPRCQRVRVIETSCCGEYEWCGEGGQYFVLRYTKQRGYEEAGRGLYREARETWEKLIQQHVHRAKAFSGDA
ncbi:hypothetical protein [Thermoactinospora rubra]|uniref:hypothetical protein n=1 Tax=Thermoactinospora rubra TaxID=1088767 RepID=UPI00117C3183|nr:hypothetical protein [Thermoactinospora rubra]